MSEWVSLRLGEVIERRTDFTQVDPDRQYVILGVQRSGWGFVRREPIWGRDQKFTKLLKVEEDDLVYRTITAFEAPSAVAGPAEDGHFVTPQTFPVFRLDRTAVLPAYMRLLTTSPAFHHEMATRCTGTVMRRKTLAIGAFVEIPVSLPPIHEQRRIVDVMAAVDSQIAALATELEGSERTISAARLALLEHRDEWKRVVMSDLVSFAGGYAFPEKFQGRATGEWPFVKCSDMNRPENRRVMTTAANWVDAPSRSALKAKSWPIGTVVFPKVGAALLTEKRRILGVEACFDNNVMGLVAGPRIRPDLLFEVMSTVRLGDFAQHGAVPSINQSHISGIPVSLPPLEVQDEIVTAMSGLHEAQEALADELDRLRMFRSALLTSLLNQDVEIPESYDVSLEAAS